MTYKWKLLVVAHCGTSGHKGTQSTLSALRETFTRENMADDTKFFIQHCLHCFIGKTGLKIPRPLALTLHGSYPNEVIHFDYLYMGMGTNNLRYVLVIRDDLSGYVWLCPCMEANPETAAQELSRWIRVFKAMEYWVSNQGSHFKMLSFPP